MKVTTFLFHNKGTYIKLKSFFDMTVLQTDCMSYINRDTKEKVPSEVHSIYIVSNNGTFNDVAYGYSRKNNFKLLEAYPNCLSGEMKISKHPFDELITPCYRTIENITRQTGYILSKQFEDCQVYGLDYFVEKESKNKWNFEKKNDEYVFSRINSLQLIRN